MRRLSVNYLLEICSSTSYDPLFTGINQRCWLQHKILLGIKSSSSASTPTSTSSSASSLMNLYQDIGAFTELFGNMDSSTAKSFINRERIIRDKFEMLDARHSTVVESFAGIVLSNRFPSSNGSSVESFLRQACGISILLQHGFYLTSKKYHNPSGCIRENTDVGEILLGSIDQANMVANHHFTTVPGTIIKVKDARPHSLKVSCIPSLINFVMFELIKNAFSAVLKRRANSSSTSLPPIEIEVEPAKDVIRIMIKDKGIGLLPDQEDFAEGIFQFARSSREKRNESLPQQSYQPSSAPLDGLGVGLYMSHLYATHFGGDLQIQSQSEGGTVVIYTISRDLFVEEFLPESTFCPSF